MKEHEDGYMSFCNYCQTNTESQDGDCAVCKLSKTRHNLSVAELMKPSQQAVSIAAQCWCDPETADRVTDPALAMAFAKRADSMLAGIGHLRQALNNLMTDYKCECNCVTDWSVKNKHCSYCNAQHALSATSGWEK